MQMRRQAVSKQKNWSNVMLMVKKIYARGKRRVCAIERVARNNGADDAVTPSLVCVAGERL